MNLFSELYIKHLARTLFFISIGVSSSLGQHLLTRNILKDDFVATVIAVGWAAMLIVIYSYFVAEREHQYNEMSESFNYHRTLKADNRINAIAKNYEDVPPVKPASTKSELTKVEFIHSMEEPKTSEAKK
jgi:hypothetical protein